MIRFDSDPNRPSGTRYGTLVHAVLATVRLDADAATIAAVTRTQGRIVAATEDEIQSAAGAVVAVLAHPVFGEARQAEHAGRCLRETPVTMTVDGTLIEGVVDVAFETAAGYTVIDFKTDRDLDRVLATYQRQVQVYAAAIAQATGRPARAVLMQV